MPAQFSSKLETGSSSSFQFGEELQLRTLTSICTLNFDNVAQSAAEILLFPVSENKQLPYWNSTSIFHSTEQDSQKSHKGDIHCVRNKVTP